MHVRAAMPSPLLTRATRAVLPTLAALLLSFSSSSAHAQVEQPAPATADPSAAPASAPPSSYAPPVDPAPLVAPPPPSYAASSRPKPAYRLSWELDVPIFLIGAAATSGFLFLDESGSGPACVPNCDRSKINALDRPSAGNYSTAWGQVGDIATAATVALPPLVVLLAEGIGDKSFWNGVQDEVVIAESALMISALQVSLSYAIARPRPRVYNNGAPLDERNDSNAARSFFSGHTANAMAVTVASARTLQKLGRPGLALVTLIGGVAGSAVVGTGRVMSGGHFPTDVIFGGLAGAGVGIAMPALHDTNLRVVPMGSADGGGGVTLVGVMQ